MRTKMNWFVKWGVKKYVLGIVNSALKEHEASVTKSREIVTKAMDKLKAVLRFLDSLLVKLADNQITSEEADAAIEDATRLAEELTR